MRDQSAFRVDRRELYRTALEFVHVARRIEKALPERKHDIKRSLLAHSGEIPGRIAQATARSARRETFDAYRQALRSATACRDLLDRLHMVYMGGFANVTTGQEILERLFAGIARLMEDVREPGMQLDDEEQIDRNPGSAAFDESDDPDLDAGDIAPA